jgi:hypothetical protein
MDEYYSFYLYRKIILSLFGLAASSDPNFLRRCLLQKQHITSFSIWAFKPLTFYLNIYLIGKIRRHGNLVMCLNLNQKKMKQEVYDEGED